MNKTTINRSMLSEIDSFSILDETITNNGLCKKKRKKCNNSRIILSNSKKPSMKNIINKKKAKFDNLKIIREINNQYNHLCLKEETYYDSYDEDEGKIKNKYKYVKDDNFNSSSELYSFNNESTNYKPGTIKLKKDPKKYKLFIDNQSRSIFSKKLTDNNTPNSEIENDYSNKSNSDSEKLKKLNNFTVNKNSVEINSEVDENNRISLTSNTNSNDLKYINLSWIFYYYRNYNNTYIYIKKKVLSNKFRSKSDIRYNKKGYREEEAFLEKSKNSSYTRKSSYYSKSKESTNEQDRTELINSNIKNKKKDSSELKYRTDSEEYLKDSIENIKLNGKNNTSNQNALVINKSKSDSKFSNKSNIGSKNSKLSKNYSNKSKSSVNTDDIKHYTFKVGGTIAGRYKIKGLLCDGTFGRVLECFLLDNTNKINRDKFLNKRGGLSNNANMTYAIKIIRPVKRYIESAEIEIDIIKNIQNLQGERNFCVKMVEYFKFNEKKNEYLAIVFEKLGISLYEFIKANRFLGFSVSHIKTITKQILEAMVFLHEEVEIIHTDLKPENILLVSKEWDVQTYFKSFPINVQEKIKKEEEYYKKEFSNNRKSNGETNCANLGVYYKVPQCLDIKIIDFGGATYFNEANDSIINTRQYRSPEVILGCCKWDEKSDVWSIGCILAELYTGELLFPTHDDREHLAMIQKINKSLFPGWMSHFCRYEYKNNFIARNIYSDFDLNCLSKKLRKNVENLPQLHVS